MGDKFLEQGIIEVNLSLGLTEHHAMKTYSRFHEYVMVERSFSSTRS